MTTTAGSPPITRHDAPPGQETSQIQRLMYRVHQYTAAAFIAGIVLQVFVVGMALFVNGSYWNMHEWVGNLINLLPATLIITSIIGRMPWSTRILSVALFLLVGMQHVTIAIGDWAGAFHPVNALSLIGIGITLFRRTTGNDADAPYR